MQIKSLLWLPEVVDKLLRKHQVTPEEVEEILDDAPQYRFIEVGDVRGEHLYAVLGQTEAGRYLIVFFLLKAGGEALVISAREMTRKEKRWYGK